MLANAENGDSIEAHMVGTEGAALLLEACGSGVGASTCNVQSDGRAWRAPAALCRELSTTNADFARRTFELLELQLAEARQSALCQGLHHVERRLARWLLESSDRAAGRNPMPLTQEFIAAMLGVQRTTVNSFVSRLQKDGLIGYRRGKIELLDMPGLERRLCECRAAIVEQRGRLQLEPCAGAVADRKAEVSATEGPRLSRPTSRAAIQANRSPQLTA